MTSSPAIHSNNSCLQFYGIQTVYIKYIIFSIYYWRTEEEICVRQMAIKCFIWLSNGDFKLIYFSAHLIARSSSPDNLGIFGKNPKKVLTTTLGNSAVKYLPTFYHQEKTNKDIVRCSAYHYILSQEHCRMLIFVCGNCACIWNFLLNVQRKCVLPHNKLTLLASGALDKILSIENDSLFNILIIMLWQGWSKTELYQIIYRCTYLINLFSQNMICSL